MTIVLKRGDYAIELFSGKLINRKKRYYKKERQEFYYIQEVIQNDK